MRRLILGLACTLLFYSHGLRAQTEPLIDVTLDGGSVTDLVNVIERSTEYRIFYESQQFDSVRLHLDMKQKHVREVLDSAFYGSQFRYSITGKQIFLTEGRELAFELPVGFFGSSDQATSTSSALYDYLYTDEQKSRQSEDEKIFEVGPRTNRIRTPRAVLSGFVRHSVNAEPVVGAVIYNETNKTGVSTDPFGYFELEMPTGRNDLKISCVGMMTATRKVMLYSNGKLDIELKEYVTPLREVIVEAERGMNVTGAQMGMERMDIRTMKQVPVAFGETDVLKVVLTLPGVQSVGESSTGLNVRGGTTDQNLILFDEATIYNSAHLFGFFSAFNPDVVKSVELYKSGIPAELGGRLSSVMEVSTREGNKKKFSASGGISPITGRLTLEGPIAKGKTSYLIGGRTTYSDWLLSRVDDPSIQNSEGSFYDLNLRLNHEINERNTLDLAAYYSDDKFKLNDDTLYQYNNLTASARWKHTSKNKLFSEIAAAYTEYQYNVSSDDNPVEAMELRYRIKQAQAKADFVYFLNEKNTISAGGSVIRYALEPGTRKPLGSASEVQETTLQNERGFESALNIGDKIDLNPKLTLTLGIRYSMFNALGPRDVYIYGESQSRSLETMTDTVSYGSRDVLATYHGPEYRISARYLLEGNSSIKLSLNRMRQYIHMLSNTTAISPTDTWKLSDQYIQPQIGDQISIGYYKNFRANTIETSVEAYYKTMDNFLDYKGGATLIMNPHIETDVLSTKGRAYGMEFMVKKPVGKLNGWISYTYSRSLLRTDSEDPAETVNQGEEYPSNFDKPHSVNVITNYRFSKRFSFSLNGTYSTGRPITVPLQKYEIDGSYRLFYTERNQYRIPDYFRIDVAMNFEGNHKIRKLAHSSWSLSIYNLTGRRNAYSVFFKSEEGVINGYQLSIFGTPIPTITYNFKF